MKTPPRTTDGPAGYVLLTVLLAVGLITGLVATYSRHVVVQARSSMASPKLLESRETTHSGVRFARQALVSGATLQSGAVPAGDGTATIAVSELPLGNQAVAVEAVDADGLGARRRFELSMLPTANSQPDGPSSLPTLDADTIQGLAADPTLQLHGIAADTTLADTELSGLVVVRAGVTLTLENVVLEGAIVSESVISQAPLAGYDPAVAPRVVVDGDLRIDSHASLPGLALLLPDGAVASGASDARVQIHGDVVAHDVSLLHPGVLAGNVSAVQLQLAGEDVLDRLGIDRKGLPWAPDLELGGVQEPRFLATVPPSLGPGALDAITGFWSSSDDG